jgi:hypothetical protein
MKSPSSLNSTILGKRSSDLLLAHAEHGAVEADVLAAGELRVEARAELEQRRDAAR